MPSPPSPSPCSYVCCTPCFQADNSKFLEVFYEEYIDQLVGAILAGCPGKNTDTVGGVRGGFAPASGIHRLVAPSAVVLAGICDLLCFCVQQHSFRMK